MDRDSSEYFRLQAIWPKKLKTRRNYDFEALQKLSALEWTELSRLIHCRVRGAKGAQPSQAQRRHAKEILRRMRVGPHQGPRVIVPPRLLLGRRKPCRILEALFPQREERWVPVARRRKGHTLSLQGFSLIDDPRKAFGLLRELAELEASSAGVTVNFVDTSCLDVSAYVVLGLMTQNMIRVMQGGSITPTISSMLNSLGLSSFLGVRSHFNKNAAPSFMPFKLQHRRRAGTSTSTGTAFQPTKGEELADQLNDTIDRWLSFVGQTTLSDDMKWQVANLVTEVLDNAVRHSDLAKSDGDWAMAGFLSPAVAPDGSGHVSYVCSLAMVSVGATVSESLGQCTDPETRGDLAQYVRRHAKSMGWGKPPHDPDLLATVYALQDGVSRFPQGSGNSKGGVGLMDTVEFMNRMSNATRDYEQPCMTLISGRACLTLKGDYRVFPEIEPGERRQLWFNPGNTLEQPPDSDYVALLPHGFPGTIVALRFCVGSTKPEGE